MNLVTVSATFESVWRLGSLFLTCGGFLFLLLTGISNADAIHVDSCADGPGEGSETHPYRSLSTAHSAANPGDVVVLKSGSYPETIVLDKPITIKAAGGPALIGAYYVGTREVCVPMIEPDPARVGDIKGSCAPLVNARIYYPTETPKGAQLACGGPFPVVAFAHAQRNSSQELCLGSQPGKPHMDYRQVNGILAHLAAAGMIVISADNSWTPIPGYKANIVLSTLIYLREENNNAQSRLKGKVDLTRVAVSGHSLGGAGAVIAAGMSTDLFDLSGVTIRAVALIAPAYERDLEGDKLSQFPENVSILVINGTNEHKSQVGIGPLNLYTDANIPKHLAVVAGANHFGYTDDICLVRRFDNPSEVGGVTGKAAQARQQLAARNYIHAFLSHYLQGKPGMLNFLLQNKGAKCKGFPKDCFEPRRLFEDLRNLNVEINVCSCIQ